MFERLRIILDAPLEGPRNMAADEAILSSVGAGISGPTLRLYRWREPTLSLGYFQDFTAVAEQPGVIRAMPVVRRPTGGGAIVHDEELTYCLVLPREGVSPALGDAFALAAGPAEMYARMHGWILQAVDSLGKKGPAALAGSRPAVEPRVVAKSNEAAESPDGKPHTGPSAQPFLCFLRHSRLDLMTGRDKLAGAAQRRTAKAVLQHGSVILRRHPVQESGSVSELAGRKIIFEELASALFNLLRGQVELEYGQLSSQEFLMMPPLLEKHRSKAWVRERTCPGPTG